MAVQVQAGDKPAHHQHESLVETGMDEISQREYTGKKNEQQDLSIYVARGSEATAGEEDVVIQGLQIPSGRTAGAECKWVERVV